MSRLDSWLPPFVALILAGLVGVAAAQAPPRRLTTVDSIRQFPGYYHLQNVLVRGEFAESGPRIVFRAGETEMGVLLGSHTALQGLVEVRAQVIDVGRLEPGDPRLASSDFGRSTDQWPRPGEALLLSLGGVTQVNTFATPTIRALALEPWKFDGQTVTVTGQFRGRNLFGDAPSSPGRSQYDFVLRNGDGTAWVTSLRPRGRGFNLDVDARVDTGRWLEVTGIVRRVRTMVTVEAKTIALASAPAEEPLDDEIPSQASPPQPIEVVFSSPTADETDVNPAAQVRIQFSRGLDAATVKDNVRVLYSGPSAALPPPPYEATYDQGTRAVTVRFTAPAERFSTVTIETLPGLRGFDGGPVVPWRVTFSFGG